MGRISTEPGHGEDDGAAWWLTHADSLPYSPELDARIPEGTVIPGVINEGAYDGDRGDVRSAARWAAGRWTLEVARRLSTGSAYDLPVESGTHLWVAAFDRSQTRHTRHGKPVRLEVAP
jgi:hypothetical protein